MSEEKKSRVCQECHVETAGRMRRGPGGPQTLCNRCGLRYYRKQRALRKKAAPPAPAAPTQPFIFFPVPFPFPGPAQQLGMPGPAPLGLPFLPPGPGFMGSMLPPPVSEAMFSSQSHPGLSIPPSALARSFPSAASPVWPPQSQVPQMPDLQAFSQPYPSTTPAAPQPFPSQHGQVPRRGFPEEFADSSLMPDPSRDSLLSVEVNYDSANWPRPSRPALPPSDSLHRSVEQPPHSPH